MLFDNGEKPTQQIYTLINYVNSCSDDYCKFLSQQTISSERSTGRRKLYRSENAYRGVPCDAIHQLQRDYLSYDCEASGRASNNSKYRDLHQRALAAYETP